MSADHTEATGGLFQILEGPALGRLERETVARGTRLIAEGSSADEMYLVETGRFTVERDGVLLAEIGAGSVIGEIAFLTGRARTADVIAARRSVVLRIDRRAYDLLCATTPGLQQAIASELAGRLAETSARVVPDPGRPKARTLCLVPSARAPLPARLAPDLARAMAGPRAVRLVTEAAFQEALGQTADPESDAALAWLNAQEREAGTVLFVAGTEASPWSRAVLRQADHVIFVAQAHRHAPPSELEGLALELIPENQRRLVLIHPHRMQRASGTAQWLASRPVFLHHHVALTQDGADIARLARFLTGRAIGMVLSGGGAFGVAHVGVWRAIQDLGIPLDIVGGTSVGSAMAGAIALGVPAEEIGPRVEDIFVRSGAMRRVTVPKYAFLDHKVLDASLFQHYGDGPIEDLWLPFYAVAADLSSMTLTELRTGPLWEAVRASSAIPGILPPFFTSEGRMLVDGGCIDNMPFRTMHRLKTGPNVVVNVQKETGRVYNVDYDNLPGRAELLKRSVLPFGKGAPRAPGLISTVMRSLLVGQGDMLKALLLTDVMIRPPGLSGAGFLAWSQHKLFYEMAYKHATEVFAEAREAGDPAMASLIQAADTP
jgi:NTE family protein